MGEIATHSLLIRENICTGDARCHESYECNKEFHFHFYLIQPNCAKVISRLIKFYFIQVVFVNFDCTVEKFGVLKVNRSILTFELSWIEMHHYLKWNPSRRRARLPLGSSLQRWWFRWNSSLEIQFNSMRLYDVLNFFSIWNNRNLFWIVPTQQQLL